MKKLLKAQALVVGLVPLQWIKIREQVGRNIVVKAVSILILLLFTACSNKDINLDPIQTLGNQLIKVMTKEKNDQ